MKQYKSLTCLLIFAVLLVTDNFFSMVLVVNNWFDQKKKEIYISNDPTGVMVKVLNTWPGARYEAVSEVNETGDGETSDNKDFQWICVEFECMWIGQCDSPGLTVWHTVMGRPHSPSWLR